MTTLESTLDPSSEASQKATVHRLMVAQALGGSAPPIIISLGGIVGQSLAPSAALATLPVSLYNLGIALSTLPIAWLMMQFGRRNAYLLAALLGLLAALLAAWAIHAGSFVLFCTATALAGWYGASVQNYRFAAADAAHPAWRGTAISRVMLGGLAAAIIGPQVVIWTRDAWVTAPFSGSFVGMGVLAALAMIVLAGLRMGDSKRPKQAAKQQAPLQPESTPQNAAHTTDTDPAKILGASSPAADAPRRLSEIAMQARFIIAVAAGVVSYGLMSFVMTAAPIAMVGCGHTVGHAALGIQWHVLGMFAPSFITGKLIERFGKITITATGLLLIALSGLMALSGLELLHFWGSLVLLGVGWNFGFIGATAMVTDCYRPSERARVQALNDFVVFGTVAMASFGSGKLLDQAGWTVINGLIFPLVAIVLLGLAWLARDNRRVRAAL